MLNDEGDQEIQAVYQEMASQVMVKIARNLRQCQTDPESTLWECLRHRRLGGFKFRRQHPVAGTHFVVDFLCYEARLVVEIDGPVHQAQCQSDAERQSLIEAQGYQVIRFTNEEVINHLQDVLAAILEMVCEDRDSNRGSSLLPEGEGWADRRSGRDEGQS
jgi:very-short-patch-repair endonuclease